MTRKEIIGKECAIKDVQLMRVGLGEYPMFPNFPFAIYNIVSVRGKQYYDLIPPGATGILWRVPKDLVELRKEI